jgi:ketosteroid isomerase-like protein
MLASACAVWDRENSFSRSVRDHDAAAFAEHVLPGAVFLTGPDEITRGRAAVVAGWGDILRGADLRLEWHPTSVEAASDGVALSRGPYWIEITKPGAPVRWLGGVFQSTWVRDADGAWRVAFDGGTPPPVPTTEEQIEKIKASIPARCPHAR